MSGHDDCELEIVPETLEQGRAFYAYHGTDDEGFRGIFDLAQLTSHYGIMRESESGMMGRGVYCTTDFSKARTFGEKVVIIKFVPIPARFSSQILASDSVRMHMESVPLNDLPWNRTGTRGVLVARCRGPRGTWRTAFNGVYVPAGTAARRSEFCIHAGCIERVVASSYAETVPLAVFSAMADDHNHFPGPDDVARTHEVFSRYDEQVEPLPATGMALLGILALIALVMVLGSV